MIAFLIIWLGISLLVGGEEASRAGFDTEEKVGLGPNEWYERGLALHREQNDEKAIDNFKRAIELEPENAEYWFSLGVEAWGPRGAGRSIGYLFPLEPYIL